MVVFLRFKTVNLVSINLYKMIMKQTLCLFLACVVTGFPQLFSQTSANPSSFDIKEIQSKYNAPNSGAVIDVLRSKGMRNSLNFRELYDLGLFTFHSQDWSNAAAIWETTALATNDPNQKALALFSASVARSFNQELREAARLANLSGQLAPNVKEIAGARLAYWTAVGDQLEIAAAKSSLSRLDLSVEGIEVIEPTTAIIVMSAIVMGSLTVMALSQSDIVKPETVLAGIALLVNLINLLLGS